MIRIIFIALVLVLGSTMNVVAQPATKPSAESPGERTIPVPPQGAAADVPVHASKLVMLSFPSKLVPLVLASTSDWEVKNFVDGVVARALTAKAKPTTLALATQDNTIKVNITLRVVPDNVEALTLVRFEAASAEVAFEAAVAAEVERRTAAINAELAKARREIDATIRKRTDETIARRVLTRLEVAKLSAHERNDDNVIVHVQRVIFVGEDAYLLFDIQNRSGSPYRLAKVLVTGPRGSQHAGPASLKTSAVDAAESGLIGVVPGGSTASAAVTLRRVDVVLGASLKLTIEEPDGRGRIVVERGIVLR